MHTRFLAIAAVAALAFIPAACSDDNESAADAPSTSAAAAAQPSPAAAGAPADADLEAFCAAGSEIETATSAIDSPEAATTVFTNLRPTIDEMVAAAPIDVAQDAQAFSSHVEDALASGDFTAFEDGTVDALVAKFEAACSGAEQ